MYRLFDNPLHLILLLVVILIVFGAGKLPSVGSALGQSIKEFKKATNEPDADAHAVSVAGPCEKCQTVIPAGAQFCPSCGTPAHAQLAAGGDESIFCAQCGAKNLAGARFCAKCGTGLNVHAG
jgi:sec-independent protein translocase protein TatA